MATGQNSTESSFGFDVDEVLEANQQPPQPPPPQPAITQVADVAALLASSENASGKAVDVQIERPDGTFDYKTGVSLLSVPDGFFKDRTVDGNLDLTGYIVCAESQIRWGDQEGGGWIVVLPPKGCEISFEVRKAARRPYLRPDAPTRTPTARRPISSFSDPMRCSHLAFSLYAYAVV